MRILVTNVGSTSLKYKLYDFPEETIVATGRVERIGAGTGKAEWNHGHSPQEKDTLFESHKEAIEFVLQQLKQDDETYVSQLSCVSFKTVIAKGYVGCELLTDEVLRAMEEYIFLAPAHNPPYIHAIKLFKDLLPNTPLIGLFEPAFHLSMPDYARVYPVPKAWREKHGIERYGFHGASHRYVSERVAELESEDNNNLKVISAHLGGSSSLCAIDGGKSVECSLGFTPQTGVFHSTRVGDLDPFAVFYAMQEEGLSLEEVNRILTKESGLKGLSGVSEDMRDIEQAMDDGNPDAKLAFQAFAYQIKKYIGAFYAVLGGLDVLAFAGGIGERGKRVRTEVCRGLAHIGIELDESKNSANQGEETIISTDQSKVTVRVIPTNEELVVARASYEKLNQN